MIPSLGRFVQTFSNQRVAFGKVQKEIKCEMINMKSSISIKEKSVVNGIDAAPQAAITLDMELGSGSGSSEDDIITSDGEDNETDEFEETSEVEETSSLSLSSDFDDDAMNRVKSAEALVSSSAVGKHSKKKAEEATKSSRMVDKQRPKEVQKKKKKKKVPNYPVKLVVPGSAKR